MQRLLACIALLVAITAAWPLTAEAGGRKSARSLPPLKDCTPINGRYGYYGNPWCTKAEQAAWDRATSRR